MISRREFLAGSVALAVSSHVSGKRSQEPQSLLVNDIHSQLNSTRVLKIVQASSVEDVQNIVRTARKDRQRISVAGGRHAMGGQQFGTDTVLIDCRKLNRVLNLDRKRGIIDVEAGIEWPGLIDGYLDLQTGDRPPWGIAQKQTGADRLTIAGTVAANAHGRGLQMKPFISNVVGSHGANFFFRDDENRILVGNVKDPKTRRARRNRERKSASLLLKQRSAG